MAFRFSPGHCNTGDCGCSECTGTLCASMTPVCVGNGDGYTVVVEDHATGTVVATGTTSAGLVCFPGLAAGSYDVAATRAGCSAATWLGVVVACGSTTTVTADAFCGGNAAINFTILWCGGRSLSGAVIAISGPDSGSLTTGPDGKATFYTDKTGAFTVTISHPSGRYAAITYTLNKLNKCNPVNDTRTLNPAPGYVCCTAVNYPVKSTLHLTIGDGAYTVDLGGNEVPTNAPVSPVFVDDCFGVAPLDILITVACTGAEIDLVIGWREIFGSAPCVGSAAYVHWSEFLPAARGFSVTGSATAPLSPPFAVSGTVGPPVPGDSALGDPTHTTTWTLTE